jgi:hypothetical protein
MRLEYEKVAEVKPPAVPQVQQPTGGAPVVMKAQPYGGVASPSGTEQWWSNGSNIQKEEFLRPWQRNPVAPPTQRAVVEKPPWTLKDIRANESKVVGLMKDMLWERFQATPDAERHDVFWQGVKQNPELAAATFVRRMAHNAIRKEEWMTGAKVPTLQEAAQHSREATDIRNWVHWASGNGSRPKTSRG